MPTKSFFKILLSALHFFVLLHPEIFPAPIAQSVRVADS